MAKYYATLMLKHGNACVEIEANSDYQARCRMFEHYGDQWAFMYTAEQKPKAIDAFGTTIIKSI